MSGTGGVDADGGGIDMYPGRAAPIMADLTKAASDVKTSWDRAIGKIAGLDSQLGNGPLGRPMVHQYNEGVKQVREGGVDLVQPQAEQLAAHGTKTVPEYVAADQGSAKNFSG
ncbi:hypothetical protein [Nocardia sp. NRRL S-836]|uniref:hypothetical protein n=1 Tax=Nocardia sp. NRRL S-836 TaxID=1519492 RepID=UPI0006AEB31B|nr:hypothetical protein [Nocardia sp. NRRL S-836]KOV87235.1 hypothetical protein ADL03_07815 [Nocardia sp. NRRL S-836]